MLSWSVERIRRCDIYNLAFGSEAEALASLFSVTLPLAVPSPKKMTSTVRSSLNLISISSFSLSVSA